MPIIGAIAGLLVAVGVPAWLGAAAHSPAWLLLAGAAFTLLTALTVRLERLREDFAGARGLGAKAGLVSVLLLLPALLAAALMLLPYGFGFVLLRD